MKKTALLLITLLVATIAFAQTKTLYDFTANTIDGEPFDFSSLKGKKVLIVNTASKCGLTPQYKKLQELHEKYGSDKFVIIGFPANNFKEQEPGSNAEIATFCQKNYGVTFQMMEKISVKGDDMHSIYQWLTNKEENGVLSTSVKWNFHKFLIDENGHLVKSLFPTVSPKSKKIIRWIKGE